MSARLPRERPAHITVHLRDGRQLTAQAGVNRGDDAAPYSRDELRTKFLDLCTRVWPLDHAEQVLTATLGLAHGTTPLSAWLEALAAPPNSGACA
jgi:2-methylcitrate dehydratase PrpD